jgi:hypothetical protein
MIKMKDINEQVTIARNKCREEVARDTGHKGFVKSRGTYVYIYDKMDNILAGETESLEYKNTKKQIIKLIEEFGQQPIRVMLAGGFDYANSPVAYYQDGDYDAWVGDWAVTIYDSIQKV